LLSFRGDNLVRRLELTSAQKLLPKPLALTLPDKELQKLLPLPDMPGLAVQLKLDEPGLPGNKSGGNPMEISDHAITVSI
jgi:hypothetical protein